MKVRVLGLTVVLASALAVWACSTNNPTRPSVSFAAPVADQPSNGLAYNFTQQPITLQIVNSVTTGTKPVTYAVEVSNNASFASPVVALDGIEQGGSGTTTATLPQLAGNITYFWRSRAIVDGVAGEPSTVRSFFVRPNLVINAPGLQQPATGASVFAPRPTFTVANATRTGPAGTIFYDFQVSNSAAFGTVIASATVQEQNTTTSWTPNADLPEGNLFWRVRAKEITLGVTGPFSNAAGFERRFGLDLAKAVIAFGPGHVATWPETVKLNNVFFQSFDTEILCTEYEDPGWPEAPFFGGPDTVYANQWVFINRGGTWYGGAAAWMRAWPQFCKRDYDQDFFKDSLGGVFPFNETVLHTGDVIGVMITSPARAWPEMKTVDQRSNVVMVPWPAGR
ncbi:MAG: hypothetical protein ABI051_08440 [Vicinamibacterales bacterium]